MWSIAFIIIHNKALRTAQKTLRKGGGWRHFDLRWQNLGAPLEELSESGHPLSKNCQNLGIPPARIGRINNTPICVL